MWFGFLNTVKNVKDKKRKEMNQFKTVKTYVLKHRIHELNKNVYLKKLWKGSHSPEQGMFPEKQNKCFNKYLAKQQHTCFKYSKWFFTPSCIF